MAHPWRCGVSWAEAGICRDVSFVYEISVGDYYLHGRLVSDEQVQAWADEAEDGCDFQQFPRPSSGLPPVGRGPERL